MTLKIKTAMVLAAGFGTRMGALSQDRPKPLILLQGKPLIDYAIEALLRFGIERLVVNTHAHAALLEDHLTQSWGRAFRDLCILREDKLLGPGGGLYHARAVLGDDPFMVMNADEVWRPQDEIPESPLTCLARSWSADQDALLLLVARPQMQGYTGAGDFVGAGGQALRRMTPEMDTEVRDGGPWVYTGVQVMSPRLLTQADPEVFSMMSLWQTALDQGRLGGAIWPAFWWHVGTESAYKDAEKCW